MEAALGKQSLDDEIGTLDQAYQVLHPDLDGRDPDEASTLVPYEKGALFLQTLEQTFGRQRLDAFLQKYFHDFAFQSVTTEVALRYLSKHLFSGNRASVAAVGVEQWVFRPGLPSSYSSAADPFQDTRELLQRWLDGDLDTKLLAQQALTVPERLFFLRSIPTTITISKLAELDRSWGLTTSTNCEVLHQWLLKAIELRYDHVFATLRQFLTTVGRRKYVHSLYVALAADPQYRQWARNVFQLASGMYHPITRASILKIFAKHSAGTYSTRTSAS